MNKAKGSTTPNLQSMGEAVSVTEDLDSVLNHGKEVFLDLNTPLAIIPDLKDGTKNHKHVKNYSIFWRRGTDWPNGPALLSQGVFSIPDVLYFGTNEAKSVLVKIKNYLSNNGFAVTLSLDGFHLSFRSDHLGRVLLVTKYPHHGNTIFSIFDLLDTSKYLSVFQDTKVDTTTSNNTEKSKTMLKDEYNTQVSVEHQPDHTKISFF